MTTPAEVFQREASYDEIRAELDEAVNWFETTLNRPIAGTRLSEVRTTFDEILLVLKGPEPEKHLFERVDETTAYYAISDAAGFNKIARCFRSLPSHILPRALLRRSLQGPLSPAAETQFDSDARNVFAQLEFAANIIQKGLEPKGFEDLSFEHDGCAYFLEAKRLWSPSDSTVRDNLLKANSQLRSAMDAADAPLSRGLILLSVDKLAGLSATAPMHLPVHSHADVLAYARRLTGEFIRRYGHLLSLLDRQVSGLLVVARFLVHSLPRNVYGPAYVPVLTPLVGRRAKDRSRLRRLAHFLDG